MGCGGREDDIDKDTERKRKARGWTRESDIIAKNAAEASCNSEVVFYCILSVYFVDSTTQSC